MGKRTENKTKIKQILSVIIFICVIIIGYLNTENIEQNTTNVVENIIKAQQRQSETIDLSKIPEYTQEPYVEINNNIPYFTDEDYTEEPFEKYSDWVDGRSGVAYANICKETMPKERRKKRRYK